MAELCEEHGNTIHVHSVSNMGGNAGRKVSQTTLAH